MLSRLTRTRLAYLLAAGVALFVAPALQAGSAPAAKSKVRIELRRVPSDGALGRFVLMGGLSDRGRFTEQGGGSRAPYGTTTLRGAKGGIRIRVMNLQFPHTGPDWRILAGTKAYAGLKGQGRIGHCVYVAPRMNCTMIGTVWGPPVG
jgi:hypothetical protein